MGYIYKITNNINGKVYIGQTTRTIKDRWKQHINDSKSKTNLPYFHKAINKYGPENFSIEKIIEAPQSELDELEIFYIKKYDSYNNGYNMTLGGLTGRKYDSDYIYALWDEGKSKQEIINITGISSHQFWEVMKNYKNYSKPEAIKRGSTIMKAIDQYDLNNNYIQSFPSIQEAARQTKSQATNIVKVLKGKMKKTNGYIWKYQQ